jgi:hypothetical protein
MPAYFIYAVFYSMYSSLKLWLDELLEGVNFKSMAMFGLQNKSLKWMN